MDKTNVIVWLLSGVSLTLWWALVNHDKFEKLANSYSAFVKNVHSLHWLSRVLSHSAFYGSVAAGLIGFKRDSFLAYFFTAWWFFGMLYFSHGIMRLAHVVGDREKSLINSKEESENDQ